MAFQEQFSHIDTSYNPSRFLVYLSEPWLSSLVRHLGTTKIYSTDRPRERCIEGSKSTYDVPVALHQTFLGLRIAKFSFRFLIATELLLEICDHGDSIIPPLVLPYIPTWPLNSVGKN